jgi:hypothetical protein
MHDVGPHSRWIGYIVQGDIGPLTLYTSKRGKMVSYPRAPPLCPPSAAQEGMRDVFRQAATGWRALTPDQRRDWLTAARRATLTITGYDLWTWFWRTRREDQLRTVERLAGLTLTRPT